MPTLLSLHLGAAYVLSFKGARLVSVSLKLPHTHKCSLPLSRTPATAIAGGLPLTPALFVCEATVCMTHSVTLWGSLPENRESSRGFRLATPGLHRKTRDKLERPCLSADLRRPWNTPKKLHEVDLQREVSDSLMRLLLFQPNLG